MRRASCEASGCQPHPVCRDRGLVLTAAVRSKGVAPVLEEKTEAGAGVRNVPLTALTAGDEPELPWARLALSAPLSGAQALARDLAGRESARVPEVSRPHASACSFPDAEPSLSAITSLCRGSSSRNLSVSCPQPRACSLNPERTF